MSLLKFEPCMFDERALTEPHKNHFTSIHHAARDAQTAFDEWLYTVEHIQFHSGVIHVPPKKPCDHQIIHYNVKNPHPIVTADCAICGAKLKAKWEVVE